jgi:hypothetical protein
VNASEVPEPVQRGESSVRARGVACVPACIEAPLVYPLRSAETMAVIEHVRDLRGVRAEGTDHLSPFSYVFFWRKETAQPPLFDGRAAWLELQQALMHSEPKMLQAGAD